jgi:hypothetical protein
VGDVHTEERYEDEPEQPGPYVDGAWGRTANPNTVDGELQNIAAFGSGLARLTGLRRHVARAIVVLVMGGLALSIVVAVVHSLSH